MIRGVAIATRKDRPMLDSNVTALAYGNGQILTRADYDRARSAWAWRRYLRGGSPSRDAALKTFDAMSLEERVMVADAVLKVAGF